MNREDIFAKHKFGVKAEPGVEPTFADAVYECLLQVGNIKNLKELEKTIGDPSKKEYTQALADRFWNEVHDIEAKYNQKLSKEILEAVFSIAQDGHARLIPKFHNEDKRDEPLHERLKNAEDQIRRLKASLLETVSNRERK